MFVWQGATPHIRIIDIKHMHTCVVCFTISIASNRNMIGSMINNNIEHRPEGVVRGKEY